MVQAVPPVIFAIQKSPRSKPFIAHVNKLKRCFGLTPVSWLDNDAYLGKRAQQAQADEQPSVWNIFQTVTGEDDVLKRRWMPHRQRRPPSQLVDYEC